MAKVMVACPRADCVGGKVPGPKRNYGPLDCKHCEEIKNRVTCPTCDGNREVEIDAPDK